MEYINRNDHLLKQEIPGGYYILDSMITKFNVYLENELLYIDVYFSFPHHKSKAEKKLKLHFIGVTEFDFSWNNKYSFYTIERYKFLKIDNGYYMSFDPYDESDIISDEDHGIVLSNEVEGYFI